MVNAEERLTQVKNECMITENSRLEDYVSGLCRRYAMVYGEILPHNNYSYIVSKLIEKNIIEPIQ